MDEYCLQALPEYEGKKFQNVAKEGLEYSDEGEKDKEKLEGLQESFKPLTKWLEETALKGMVSNIDSLGYYYMYLHRFHCSDPKSNCVKPSEYFSLCACG